ncbi:cytidylyltransferase domain-containing protein [Cellvibrio sp. pealriver]|uniref:acylneuraminate cytidylyltransferase family protein n=1 Tax=Cellvibrio sp. pealriver TaxID=1622269 RepID=UPI00066FE21F|nr:acylneuraminate cytidylyltransferase family protein [Cellvibrio sp. pealriver]
MSKVFALIPARGWSKSLWQKNIAPVLEQPLIAYSIQAAHGSEVVDAIYVSSDDDQILSVAHYYNTERLKRDPHLAEDESPLDAVVAEFIHRIKPAAKDIIILLKPTSPLRTARHIREALAEFKDFPTCRSLISVYEINNAYVRAYVGGGEFLHPLAGEHSSYYCRKDLPSLYMPNGAIYIFKVDDFMREEKIPLTHTIPYLMPASDSIEVCSANDLQLVENRLRERANF